MNLTRNRKALADIQNANNQYLVGTQLTVTATPQDGWEFVRWEGDVSEPTQSTTTLFMHQDETVKAVFAQPQAGAEDLASSSSGSSGGCFISTAKEG